MNHAHRAVECAAAVIAHPKHCRVVLPDRSLLTMGSGLAWHACCDQFVACVEFGEVLGSRMDESCIASGGSVMRCGHTLSNLDRSASSEWSTKGEGSLHVGAVGRPRKLVIGPKKSCFRAFQA